MKNPDAVIYICFIGGVLVGGALAYLLNCFSSQRLDDRLRHVALLQRLADETHMLNLARKRQLDEVYRQLHPDAPPLFPESANDAA